MPMCRLTPVYGPLCACQMQMACELACAGLRSKQHALFFRQQGACRHMTAHQLHACLYFNSTVTSCLLL